MGHKGIRGIGFLGGLVSLVWLGVLVWTTFGSGSSGESPMLRLMSQGFLLVFISITFLASHVGTVVERQADQIAALERQLAELQSLGHLSKTTVFRASQLFPDLE